VAATEGARRATGVAAISLAALVAGHAARGLQPRSVTSVGRGHGARLQKTSRFVFFACPELVEAVIFVVKKSAFKSGAGLLLRRRRQPAPFDQLRPGTPRDRPGGQSAFIRVHPWRIVPLFLFPFPFPLCRVFPSYTRSAPRRYLPDQKSWTTSVVSTTKLEAPKTVTGTSGASRASGDVPVTAFGGQDQT